MFFFTSVHAAYMFPISLAHPSLHMIMFTEPWLTNLARVCALIYLNCGKKKVHLVSSLLGAVVCPDRQGVAAGEGGGEGA